MRVERVESSEVKKKKVASPVVPKNLVGADAVHDADATEKQTRHRGRHAHAVEARPWWNESRYGHGLLY